MQRTKSYYIKGHPIPWARAGLYKNKFFDTQKNQKLYFGITLQGQHNDEPLFDRPMLIEMKFFMPIPQTARNLEKYKIHSCKPDLDNLIKFLLDAIKNVVIKDDRMIHTISASKMYDREPRTEFTVKEIEKNG